MSNNDDAFTSLLKKRALRRSHTAKPTVGVTKSAPKKTIPIPNSDWSARKERTERREERKKGLDPSSPLDLAFGSELKKPSRVEVRPKSSSQKSKRVRHLIHVDMVDAENRQAVEDAAEADGRSVSQWCRLVLLRATKHG